MTRTMPITKAEEILQLIGIYTLEMAKKKYRKLQKDYHPDIHPGIDTSLSINANLAFETVEKYFETNHIQEKKSSFIPEDEKEKYDNLLLEMTNFIRKNYLPESLRKREEINYFANCYQVVEYYDNILTSLRTTKSYNYEELSKLYQEIKTKLTQELKDSTDNFCIDNNLRIGDLDVLLKTRTIHKIYQVLSTTRDQQKQLEKEHVPYIMSFINKINTTNYKNTINEEEREYFNNVYRVIDNALKELNDQILNPSENYQIETQKIYNQFKVDYDIQSEISIKRYIFDHGISEEEILEYVKLHQINFNNGVHSIYQLLVSYKDSKKNVTERLQSIIDNYQKEPYFNELSDQLDILLQKAIKEASLNPNNIDFVIARLNLDIREHFRKYTRFIELTEFGRNFMEDAEQRIEYHYYKRQIDELYQEFKNNINDFNYTDFEVKRRFTNGVKNLYREYEQAKEKIRELQSAIISLEAPGITVEIEKIRNDIQELIHIIGQPDFNLRYATIKEAMHTYKYESTRRIEINKLYKIFMYKLNQMLQNEKDLTAAYPKYNQASEIVTTILKQFEKGLISRSFISAISELSFRSIDELLSKLTPLIPAEVYINPNAKTEWYDNVPIYVERQSINGNKVYRINSDGSIDTIKIPSQVLKTKCIPLREILKQGNYVGKTFGDSQDKYIAAYESKDYIVYFEEDTPDYIEILKKSFRLNRKIKYQRKVFDTEGYNDPENIIGQIIYSTLMITEPYVHKDNTFEEVHKYTKKQS